MVRSFTLRLFGLVAACAVGSFWKQLPGLSGVNGVSPAVEHLEALRSAGYSVGDVPTLLWLWAADGMLHLLCALGLAASGALVVGFAPRLALGVLWATWLSLVSVCSPFLNFQWDVLLIESAFCLFFYAPAGWRPDWSRGPHPAARFLMAWLACKVTLGSGLVKLMSGDPTWRDLTALSYHWWSQPLPTWTSVVLNELPLSVQRVLCAIMFVLELPIPLLALGPKRVQRIAGVGLVALQVGLFAAGNYAYYNVLAAVLALPLFGDATTPERPMRWAWPLALVACAAGIAAFFHHLPETLTRWKTINRYGAFAHMTKTRSEIIVEGSRDGTTWAEYAFHFKPGALDARPEWVAPFQPRLDWQMWFASLGNCSNNEFVIRLQWHVLRRTPEVMALLAEDPFRSGAPPTFIRTLRYEYRFAPWSTPGVWWTRTPAGPYCPPVMLAPDGRLQRAPE